LNKQGMDLSLPDLPEVPISLGREAGPGDGPARGRHRRGVTDLAASWLPLLLMAALALGSWWLLRKAPQAVTLQTPRAERLEPDFTMGRFVVQRFDVEGRLRLEIEGQAMRHYPQGDRVEVDDAIIRAYAPDGRQTTGTARRILSDGKASDVLLTGGARVEGTTSAGQASRITGEALRMFPREGRLRSDDPVDVRVGQDEMQAAGMLYDDVTGQITLVGPMRVVLPPRVTPSALSPAPRSSGLGRPASRGTRAAAPVAASRPPVAGKRQAGAGGARP
jgi:lipopolysaccharide export system protein LptC